MTKLNHPWHRDAETDHIPLNAMEQMEEYAQRVLEAFELGDVKINGYWLAIRGKKRCSYYSNMEHDPFVYDERVAWLFKNKKDCIDMMSHFYETNREMWRYMMVVPISFGMPFPLYRGE